MGMMSGGFMPHKNFFLNMADPLGGVPLDKNDQWKNAGKTPTTTSSGQPSPVVSRDISREEMRKRGRAALIASGSQGVLGNAPTGRNQLLAA